MNKPKISSGSWHRKKEYGNAKIVVFQYEVKFCYDTFHPFQNTQEFNTLRPVQNGRNFPDNSLRCISLNEKVWILNKISLKVVPKGPINNISVLVQITAWWWTAII